MKVIQELQGNRPIIVRVFDELARQLAPRVFFTSLQMQAQSLAIQGVAESNNRISKQLRTSLSPHGSIGQTSQQSKLIPNSVRRQVSLA
ncbi:MAG: PilN domain-containing protein [Candidatus Azotimanducaceae bacterium WSBS_2022_MAG_OTU7]